MNANARPIDRMIPTDVGGYPVNYGFVPQTVSYDGDPFDALVLGPPLPDGQFVRGVIVGVMFMEDEKGLDSKVVLSRTDASGRPVHALTCSARAPSMKTTRRALLDASGFRYRAPATPSRFDAIPSSSRGTDKLARTRSSGSLRFYRGLRSSRDAVLLLCRTCRQSHRMRWDRAAGGDRRSAGC
jgi:hypothetical protein